MKKLSVFLSVILFISSLASSSLAVEIDKKEDRIEEDIARDEVSEKDIEEVDKDIEKLEDTTYRDGSRNIVHEGYLGPDNSHARWTLDDEGNLYFHKGKMGRRPNSDWSYYRADIRTIVMGSDGTLETTEDMNSYFNQGFINLDSLEIRDVDFSKTSDAQFMFSDLNGVKVLDLRNLNVSNLTNMRSLFNNLKTVEEIDLSNFDTRNTTRMDFMFNTNKNLKRLDLRSFDTSQVDRMEGMFYEAHNLEYLDISSFDTSKVTDMDLMFCNNRALYTIVMGEKSILNERVTLPQMKPNAIYTGGWTRDDGSKRYDTSLDFTKNYDGSNPGTYIREYTSYDVSFKNNTELVGVASSKGHNRKLSLAEVPVAEKDGYSFLEWNTDPNGDGDVFEPENNLITEDITVYAIFKEGGKEKVRVTLDGNGGSFSDNSREKSVELVKGESLTRPEDPSRSGYSFEGWRLDGETSNFDFSKAIDKDMVLKAAWKADGTRPPINPPVDPEPPVIPPIEPPITPPVTPDIDDEDGKLNKADHLAYINGYKDNTVRPEANITREEVSAVFFRLLTKEFRDEIYSEEVLFTDVGQERWSLKEIASLNNGGIVEGYPDGSFRPGKNITRAEIATMAARFEDIEADGEKRFTDIEGHWAEDYINAAASKGWVQVTREALDQMTR